MSTLSAAILTASPPDHTYPITVEPTDSLQWFALRDLKRANALRPAWRELSDEGFDVFTPTRRIATRRRGRTELSTIAVIPDLLFVHSTRNRLDPRIASTPTLQYRFVKGLAHCQPLTVPTRQMDTFMRAVSAASPDSIQYLTPDQITPAMYGREVVIVGGPMDGICGRLLSRRGLRTPRLLISIPTLTASITISPEYIKMI